MAEEVKIHCHGVWWYSYPFATWNYSPPGLYDPGVERPTTVTIPGEEVRQLITALDEAGWIVPRLDERLRNEDLKIIHRLLNIVSRSQK